MSGAGSSDDALKVDAAAARLLADSYRLYLKTHDFHWNVTGPMFSSLHTLFEIQYTELALAVDEIAERIRALGAPAPGSYAEFARLSSVKDATNIPTATEMLEILVADQATVVAGAAEHASGDLGVRRIELHEKNAWMLRSHLE